MRGEQGVRGGRRSARAMRRLAIGAGLVMSSLFLLVEESGAQTALSESVAGQSRPDFAPIGVRSDLLGSFILFPKFVSGLN